MLRLAVVLLVASVVSPLATSLSPTKAFVVATGSMEPAIPTGSLAFAGPGEPRVGDVIVYWSPVGANQIHRVLEIRHLGNETYYTTRGDANDATDSFSVPDKHARGIVKGHTPFLGYLWLLPTPWQVALFSGLLCLYLGITAWDARALLRPRASLLGTGLLVLLLAPTAWAAVQGSYASTELSAAVATPPLPIEAGSMGSADIAADRNSATVTVSSPKLWGEVVLWGCRPGATSCTVAFPPANYAEQAGTLTQINTSYYDPAPTFFLEAYLAAPPNRTASVVLHDKTNAADVAGSEISTTAGTPVLIRGGGFTLAGDREYVLRLRHNGTSGEPDDGALHMAKLISVHQYPTKTVTQVRLSSASSTTSESYAVPSRGTKWQHNGASIDGLTSAFFEAVVNVTAGVSSAGSVRLVDRTAGSVAAEVSVAASTTEPSRLRSADMRASLVDGHEYEVEFKRGAGSTGDELRLHLARVILLQNGFNKTVRYVDLSWQATTSSDVFTTLGYPGRYHMDTEWGGITGYFEATLANSDPNGTSSARLYDNLASGAVASSQIDAIGPTMARVRSGSVTLNVQNTTYAMQLRTVGGTAEVRAAWLVVYQSHGKTFDHVLRTRNDAANACTWSFNLEHVSDTDLGRITTANLTLRTSQGSEVQVRIHEGVLAQASGTAVSAAFGDSLEQLVSVRPASAGSTSVTVDLRGLCAGTGIRTHQPLTFVMA